MINHFMPFQLDFSSFDVFIQKSLIKSYSKQNKMSEIFDIVVYMIRFFFIQISLLKYSITSNKSVKINFIYSYFDVIFSCLLFFSVWFFSHFSYLCLCHLIYLHLISFCCRIFSHCLV